MFPLGEHQQAQTMLRLAAVVVVLLLVVLLVQVAWLELRAQEITQLRQVRVVAAVVTVLVAAMVLLAKFG
jgi:membrane-anchored protein YejM (alkaline phosphatase superfamily)